MSPAPADRRLVVAVDTSDRTEDVLALGRVLAAATSAPVRLVTVFPYALLEDPADPRLEDLRAEAEATLVRLAGASGLGDDAGVEVIPGRFAARELQEVSERSDTALLVVGSTGRGPVGRVLVGGVGERLLSGSNAPVAVAPHGYAERAPDRLQTVAVGIDASDESRHALHAAVLLARSAGARLRVITAFQELAFGGVSTATFAATSANDALRKELLEAQDQAVASASQHVAVEPRFGDGPASEILRAESRDADLLVLGSRGYGPHAAVLVGSSSTALARDSEVPLLVVPRGTALDLGGP